MKRPYPILVPLGLVSYASRFIRPILEGEYYEGSIFFKTKDSYSGITRQGVATLKDNIVEDIDILPNDDERRCNNCTDIVPEEYGSNTIDHGFICTDCLNDGLH